MDAMPSTEKKYASSKYKIELERKNNNMLLSLLGIKLSEVTRKHLEVRD